MKVTFKDKIRTITGKDKDEDLVYVAANKKRVAFMRRYKYPKISEYQHSAGNKVKAVGHLWHLLSEDFKNDLRRYTDAYNNQLLDNEKAPLKAYNVWTKALCKHTKPFEDLQGVSKTLGKTLNDWIEKGFLQRVNVNTEFKAKIV
jgi:hypothetical protein